MLRRRRLILAAGFVAVAAALGWWRLWPPDPRSVDADRVRRVEVRFEPWGEEMARPPGGASEDRGSIAALAAVLRSARESPDHKCGSRGTVTFRRSTGPPAKCEFLPGHHLEWYEVRAGDKVYQVPCAEFVAAMRRVGVEVPLDSQ